MKRLLLLMPLILLSHLQYAQCPTILVANLDSGSISKQQMHWFLYDSAYLSFPNLIFIDTVHYPRNQWQVGRPQKAIFDSAYSYPNAIVTDTLHPCMPRDTSAFIIRIPMLGEGLCSISFYYKLDIDSGDIAFIETSDDAGHNWYNILVDSSRFYFPIGKPNLAASTVGWDFANIDNNNFFHFPDSPLLRFTFISDSNVSPRAGWMLDNFRFGYYQEGVPQITNNYFLDVYPNPARTEITITSSQRITDIALTSLVGQIVYRKPCKATEVTVDVSNLPVGVYLVRINGIEFRRFVKE